jgi:hypothetical protein
MEYNRDKVDEVALALLSLAMFSDRNVTHAWKEHAWEALDRLHEKGTFSIPEASPSLW